MTTPHQGPALAITDVANDAALSYSARLMAVTIHHRAAAAVHTGVMDLCRMNRTPGADETILRVWDELAEAGVIDADGWPATVIKP